ncbi:hypothetical protein F383_32018 [Gossypium arboreum]|uniref:Uncharacterized protein n=1 Tax=Gossypium arboreum TaxID=29729 RepID=A0A0B0N385_GOSAR|nr:hypothetical protein F383_32018 [Gossypium arboreum]
MKTQFKIVRSHHTITVHIWHV